MYSQAAGTRKTLGDVDVVYHDGIYHLFHLVLPNHDFVAHAVSNNCMVWRRVENALFIGDPGSWDDSMLWTVHVSPNPHRPGSWRMFYTGLSRRDHGAKQRIGLATSDNLYVWKKEAVNWEDRRSPLPYDLPGRPPQPPFDFDADSCFPIEPNERFYESRIDEGRHWVSWRDPYYFHDGDRGLLLAAGRVATGPVVRRGCVALMEETAPNCFATRPPLFHPGLYDDIEVPNLFRIDGECYLLGSMREDAKIRYWHARHIDGPWQSYADNVLLATGNYAGRVSRDDRGFLLWSFFTPGGLSRTVNNLMPPPKRLARLANGQLQVQPFEMFDTLVERRVDDETLGGLLPNVECSCKDLSDGRFQLESHSGFQAFVFPSDFESFRMRAALRMINEGKCGILFRLNRESRDGYYLSLDLFKGVAQLRVWATGPEASGERMLNFQSIQDGYWERLERGCASVCLSVYGSYIEFSIGSRVLLSLADQSFHRGAVGFYAESSILQVSSLELEHYQSPVQSDEHLANG